MALALRIVSARRTVLSRPFEMGGQEMPWMYSASVVLSWPCGIISRREGRMR